MRWRRLEARAARRGEAELAQKLVHELHGAVCDAHQRVLDRGLVRVDFDAYIKESGAVRDHGVKFRVEPQNIGRLYDKRERII